MAPGHGPRLAISCVTNLAPVEIPLVILSLFFITATALPFIRTENAWVRMFDFPRTQVLIGGFCTIVISLFFLGDEHDIIGYGVLGLLLLCVLYQGYRMYPYTRFASQQVLTSARPHPEVRFSLLISNVLQENRNAEKYLEIVRAANPDILLAVETDTWWTTQLETLANEYAYTVKHPLDNCYGMLLFSRLKLVEPTVQHLIDEDIPSIHTKIELRSKEVIALHCLHPRPPRPDQGQDATERDAELLIVGREVKAAGKPALVAGDLNDVAWSSTTTLFQKISGLLDPRVGRGMYNTFNAHNPLLRWPLDHVFHSAHFRLVTLKKLPYFGSDHFPMYIELSYKPLAEAQQEHPPATQNDRARAAEKIEQADQKEPVPHTE